TLPVHLTRLNPVLFGFHSAGVRAILSSSLWLRGYPEQALQAVDSGMKEILDPATPPLIAVVVLGLMVFVQLRTGRWVTAQELIARVRGYVTSHGLSTYAPLADGWEGSLAVLRGDAVHGVGLLRGALTALHTDGYEMHRRALSAALAEGFASVGQYQ